MSLLSWRCSFQVRTWGQHPFCAGRLWLPSLCTLTISEMTCSVLQDFSSIPYWKCASTVLSTSNPDHWVVWPPHNDKFWYNFKWHKPSVLQMQWKSWHTYYADSCSKSWPKGGRRMLQKGQVVINILWMQLRAVFLVNNFFLPFHLKAGVPAVCCLCPANWKPKNLEE